MSLSPIKRILPWIASLGKDRRKLALLLGLLAIMGLGAYLRLWNINHLFNVIHDYDEGAWSLASRFISQGYLPYQDFVLAHPPLYNLVLAAVYKIFGYSFFYGRYLSVALSLACIILIYFIGKKMYHPVAGIAAAALFAVSTEMVYFGRRPTQEILSIFLILLAIYFAFDFINERKQGRLLLCGLALGLAAATKYIFVPAVIAIIVAIILLSMGENFWQSIRKLGRPSLWVMYICFAAMFYALLLLLKYVLWLNVAIPFLDPMYLTAGNVMIAVLVFVVPFFISAVMLKKELPFKKWWLELWGLRRSKGLWMLVGGTVLGFICVTGFFLAKAPQEFISQTLLMQANRPYTEFPSLAALIRVAPLNPTFLRMAALPIIFAIPLIFVLLNKRGFSKSDCFLSVALIASLLLCQVFYHVPRYYASIFLFLFLGVSWLVPPVNVKMLTARLKAGLLVFLAIILFSLSLSVVLLRNYTSYTELWSVFSSNEEQVYEETIDFLERTKAEKIYGVSPTVSALSTDIDSTLAFDTFALLFLEKKEPGDIVTDLMDEGVDYIVLLSSYVSYWSGSYKQQLMGLIKEVRGNSRLVKVIEPDSRCSAEIYLLGAEAEGIFNGDFEHWVRGEEMAVPLGWESVLIKGEGDEASISEANTAGKNCLKLAIYENGQKDEELEWTHAGIVQDIPFPEAEIAMEVFPEVNTEILGRTTLGLGIHFLDDDGHSLVIGFSDEIDTEEIFQCEECGWMVVIKPAQLYQWSEHSIDLAAYWSQAGWQQPEEINMLMVLSTYYNNPGHYAFYVARVEMSDVQTETIR